MSFQTQSGDLSPFSEIVPEGASYQGLSRSSLLTQRRRVRIVPQGGRSTPTIANGGAQGTQLMFMIADQGGMVDMRSIVINYQQVTAVGVPDDGHPFSVCQIGLNGQLLDNITSAPKLTNVEMKMGGSKNYYQSAGSLQGFELLNSDTVGTLPAAAFAATDPAWSTWGNVFSNAPSMLARYTRAATPQNNSKVGAQRSIPLGLISGVGRIKQYLPVATLGELTITLVCGAAAEVCFNHTNAGNVGYSLSDISLEYDVVVPHPSFAEYLQKVSQEPGTGLTIPFESSIVAGGGVITASTTAQKESTIVVSRATNHLLRSSVVQVPSALGNGQGYPSQSAFSHAGVWSAQWRIGSMSFPQIPAEGDASLFNMSMLAYGSPTSENGSVVNRSLWCNSTDPSTMGTPQSFAADRDAASAKFAYGDSFIPSYGFQTVKGGASPLAVDGVSLAGASGSQVQVAIVSAPLIDYVPFVILTAIKFISCKGGATTVVGG